MLFIIFVLFFTKYFQANSLQCMTNAGGTLLSLQKCEFELNIDDEIPDDTQLIATVNQCAIDSAATSILWLTAEGSCYGEVSIDYNTKKMKFQLTHVSDILSLTSPYDDMFGFLNDIESVVQYKINGNLEKETLQITTRIQCKTYDNCALDKLRKLRSNLMIIDARKNIFKDLINFLNPPEATPTSELMCIDNADAEMKCEGSENRCKYERSKSDLEKSCTTEDSNGDYDLEYRFNIIQDMKDTGTDNSAKALKCFYLCKTDFCNSEENFRKVDDTLIALALGSETHANSHTTVKQKPAPQTNLKPKSDGVSFHVSFYYRSMIIFFLFIQLLSN